MKTTTPARLRALCALSLATVGATRSVVRSVPGSTVPGDVSFAGGSPPQSAPAARPALRGGSSSQLSFETRYTPGAAQKRDPRHGTPIGRMVFPPAQKPKEPYAPSAPIVGSPPSYCGEIPCRGRGIVPSTDEIAVKLGDAWQHSNEDLLRWYYGEGYDNPNLGWSCQEACMRCEFNSASQILAGGCACYASCTKGSDRTICTDPSKPGWTDDAVTGPVEAWEGQCGHGQRNCRERCLSADFIAEMEDCRNHAEPSFCIEHLSDVFKPPRRYALSPREENVMPVTFWCSMKGLERCEQFWTAPANSTSGEGQWRCYQDKNRCEGQRKNDQAATPEGWIGSATPWGPA